jgi:hypothetical protein
MHWLLRKLGLSKPPDPVSPFPRDATMFFCIGAQKAGTTWLHDYLSRSEEVHFSRNKELHYFDVRAGRGGMALRVRVNAMHVLTDKLDTNNIRLNKVVVDQIRDAADLLSIYTGQFQGEGRHDPYLVYLAQGWNGQPVIGDITPSYCTLDREHFTDMAHIGQAKFIFILRDPVSRMWSHIRMNASQQVGAGADAETLAQACRDWVQNLVDLDKLGQIERADYVRTMTELEASVPAERILYVFYEDLFEGDATRQICEFLGIAHRFPETGKRVNQGASVPLPDDIRTIFRQAFAPQYEAMRARFGDRIPDSWMT